MISSKLMGLAALALLAGSMGFTAVGCSSESTGDDDDDVVVDGGGSSSGRPRTDGGSSSGDTNACTPAQPEADFFSSYPGSLVGKQGSCTTAEIATVGANFKKTGITKYTEFAAGVSDTCKSCFMRGVDGTAIPETDVPLFIYVNGDEGRGFANGGWCAANTTGSNVACGKAVATVNECSDAACSQGNNCGAVDETTGEPDADFDACLDQVSEDDEHACNTLGQEALGTNCSEAALSAVVANCFTAPNNEYAHWVEVACGPAGSTGDAGTGDAGQ